MAYQPVCLNSQKRPDACDLPAQLNLSIVAPVAHSYADGGKIPYQALATQNTPDVRPVSPAVTLVNLSGARILSPGFGGEKYSLPTHIIASIANKPAPRFSQAAVTLEGGNDLKQTKINAKEDKAIESNATFFELLICGPCDIVYCRSK
ncbi:hypothetical protein HU811_01355 [Pseudomonas sp. SWRI196]|uniref:Uncharacterized protein n=1 Tax=Pseudomonas tehranensis TaxID=2745502 RepID=A0ABR6UKZ3_9PSED|nr:hypothetical protein [Pseudomonas tehranensis]MBC3345280.1 hypothetical protein [Pseudomonas tehranensis]